MAIVDGQRVRALESNAAWASKSVDNTFTGIQTLNNGSSGAAVVNLQQAINDILADMLLKIDLAEKGAVNGVATLDGSGKVPIGQIPDQLIGAVSYQGTWNATTNSPTLSDGTGTKGHYYVVTVAGTQDLGSGNISFDVTDWVIHNGTAWERLNTSDIVSVNSQTGVVVIDTIKVEYRALTALEVANKQLTLAETPTTPGEVCLDVQGGPAQFYDDDFVVSGTTLSWNGLGLDGILETGDKVRIVYNK